MLGWERQGIGVVERGCVSGEWRDKYEPFSQYVWPSSEWEALQVNIIALRWPLEKQGECRVVCACDPHPDAFLETRERWEFAARVSRSTQTILRMLDAHRHDSPWSPFRHPFPSMRRWHRAAMERGLACYLEKPPTLDYVEFETMLAVEVTARKQRWRFQLSSSRRNAHAMKRRLLNGEFGAE